MHLRHHHSRTLRSLLSGVWTHRNLILLLTKRSVQAQYQGSVLGLLWALFHPLLLLGVYTLIFTGVFSARWAGEGDRVDYALALFAGLVLFNFLAECLSTAPTLLVSHGNFVKKVVFPLEVLAWSTVGKSLFHLAASLVILLVGVVLVLHHLPWQVVLLPLIVIPLSLMCVGCIWLVSSLAVFLKDVTQAVQVVVLILMFLSPIFYPIEAVPEGLRVVLDLNPLTPLMAQSRSLFLYGQTPSISSFLLTHAVGIGMAWFGFAWFQSTRDGFADVL